MGLPQYYEPCSSYKGRRHNGNRNNRRNHQRDTQYVQEKYNRTIEQEYPQENSNRACEWDYSREKNSRVFEQNYSQQKYHRTGYELDCSEGYAFTEHCSETSTDAFWDYNSMSYSYANSFVEEGSVHSDQGPQQGCCHDCAVTQYERSFQDQGKGHNHPRDDKTRVRLPGQAEPCRVVAPKYFSFCPYAEPEKTEEEQTQEKFEVEQQKTRIAKYEMLRMTNPEQYNLQVEKDQLAEQEKRQKRAESLLKASEKEVNFQVHIRGIFPSNILCLRWVNGTCGEKRKNATKELDCPVECPYAHPDLSEVPEGVCVTCWFTGFCRFHRRGEAQVEPGEPEDDALFGWHGWAHFKRLENPSDECRPDNEADNKKKSQKSRRRPPSVCYSCHHAMPEGGYYLLPGISCKTTVLEREVALGFYPWWSY